MKDKKRIFALIGLQMAVFLYACTGYFTKMAARESFLSFRFCFFYACMIGLLGVYAILWQQFLKRFPLTTCYASRAMSSVWTMLIAFVAFRETISWNMILGAFVIITGVYMVVTADE